MFGTQLYSPPPVTTMPLRKTFPLTLQGGVEEGGSGGVGGGQAQPSIASAKSSKPADALSAVLLLPKSRARTLGMPLVFHGSLGAESLKSADALSGLLVLPCTTTHSQAQPHTAPHSHTQPGTATHRAKPSCN